ncbi:unnamed protein product [marine sediment metagenome]|uniref:Uncharacterized protein n=1 Tax=marine sediment metagenome TaxID=412755 RepID=X1M1M4_9ZZZZ
MKIDKKLLSWLTNCPASDVNFKNNLLIANIATLREALFDENLTKTARLAIERRLKWKFYNEKANS